MIAIILAAGKGTRLSEFYSCSSKCMIPFEGKPLIAKILNNLSHCRGLKKICIVIRAEEEEIPSYFGRGYYGIPIEYYVQDEEKPGIINAVYSVSDLLKFENEDVIINLGDEYYENIDYKSLINKHNRKKSSVTPIVVYCEDTEEVKKNYTVNITDTDEIIDAVEKPLKVFNNYVGTGILLISGKVLKDFALNCNNNFDGKQLVDWMKFSIETNRHCYVQKVETGFCNLNYQEDLEYLYKISYKKTMETICNMFTEVITSYPDRKAIVFEENSITFKNLDEKSNVIASNIRKGNFMQEDCLAIICSDPIKCIIDIIAVLKAGGYYVILDKKYSKETIDYIIEKEHIKIIIEDNVLMEKKGVENQKGQLSYVEEYSSCKAFILFSSRSKEFNVISKKSIVNLVMSMKESVFDNCKKDFLEIGITSELSMNRSVPFLYTSLLYGHTLNIISKRFKADIQGFITKLNEVDICDITPSMLSSITKYIEKNSETKIYVKILVSNGEELKKEIIHRFFKQCTLTTVINSYGMAACTVQSIMFYINKESENRLKKIPIGKPIRNTRVYILDSNKKIVGAKTVGDIWIAGDGICLENFQISKLSNCTFSADIINNNRKMFNTGNRGYFDLDGNIYLK